MKQPSSTATQKSPTFKSRLSTILIAAAIEAVRAILSHPLADICIEVMKKSLEVK
jgi:hypothetical protein